MDSFDNLFKTACNIKSVYLNQDKQQFNKLPDFYKSGLYVYELTNNVRNQKLFILKKASYEILKQKGNNLVILAESMLKESGFYDNNVNNNNNYINEDIKNIFEDANYEFTKALSIFKYIKCNNPKWKTEGGIKDEELSYHETEGKTIEEKYEINKFIISLLLNISACDLKLEKYEEVRSACNEVLKRDASNIKAYYRIAKSYLECKSSGQAEYEEALENLKKCKKINNNIDEINTLYCNLESNILKYKTDERKVFKSFFRKINEQYSLEKETENVSNLKKEEEKLGRPQLAFLNLLIDNCNIIIKNFENNKSEYAIKQVKDLKNCESTAIYYKKVLEDMLELDFDNPNDFLLKFSKDNKADLKDPMIQDQFIKVREEHINKINEFYNKNFGDLNKTNVMHKGSELLNPNNFKVNKSISKSKEYDSNKNKPTHKKCDFNEVNYTKHTNKNKIKASDIQKKINIESYNKSSIWDILRCNKKIKKDKKNNSKLQQNNGWSLSFSAIVVLSILLIYYLTFDILEYLIN